MRVLCATTSGAGHYRPLFPIARALADAGHEVVFACPDSASESVGRHGFEVAPFDDAEVSEEQERLFAQFAESGDATFGERAVGLGFGLLSPLAALPRLEATWSALGPELVVRDPAEFASSTLADRHEVPSVIAMGGLQAIFPFLGRFVQPPLAELRRRLRANADGWLTDRLIVTPTPPTFDEPSGEPIEVQRYADAGTGTYAELPESPRVYATLGTEVMRSHRGLALLSLIIEGLARAEVPGIVTTGVEVERADLPPSPAGVEIVDFAPHVDVIPSSRLVITHGGAGTVHDALVMGRPMIVLPQFADQFINASRVEAVGAGRALMGGDQTADKLVDAIGEALTGAFDQTSRSMAEEAASLPPVTDVVRRLESIVSG